MRPSSGISDVFSYRLIPDRLLRIACALAVLVCLGATLRAADRGEYEVKAAFLVNFTHFVEWPDSASAGPFKICIVGSDPFGPILEKVVGDRTVNGRPVVIKRMNRPAAESSCQIAFFGDVEKPALLRVLPAFEADHTLTVGDSLDFARRYGVIGFFVENQRVSLALHAVRASRTGLKINSQLMRVVRIVSDDGSMVE